jgi:hypothetical protein
VTNKTNYTKLNKKVDKKKNNISFNNKVINKNTNSTYGMPTMMQ